MLKMQTNGRMKEGRNERWTEIRIRRSQVRLRSRVVREIDNTQYRPKTTYNQPAVHDLLVALVTHIANPNVSFLCDL